MKGEQLKEFDLWLEEKNARFLALDKPMMVSDAFINRMV
jgi:hypothetical protein